MSRPGSRSRSLLPGLVACVLAVASRGLSQEPGPAPGLDAAAIESRTLARARARALLADGPGAPRPDLRPGDPLEVDPAPVHPMLGPCVSVALRGPGGELRALVTLELAGVRPVGLLQPDREVLVRRRDALRRPRDPAAIAAEVQRRCTLGPDALRARALAFLERVIDDALARRFELVREEREREGLCSDTFVFVESPRDGVAACVQNLVRVTLQPETGDVVAARWTDLRHERLAAPPIDARRAEAIARASGAFGPCRAASLRLLFRPATEAGRGPLVAVWGVVFSPLQGEERVVRLVDADRGTLLGEP